jgi:hypothetical protein
MADGYLIGPDFLGRIRRTVDAAEAAPMRLQTGKIPVRLEGEEGSAGITFRICTYTATSPWTKSSDKVVVFKYQTTTPNTVTATNLFADVGTATAGVSCAIHKEGTAWFLIAAECL